MLSIQRSISFLSSTMLLTTSCICPECRLVILMDSFNTVGSVCLAHGSSRTVTPNMSDLPSGRGTCVTTSINFHMICSFIYLFIAQQQNHIQCSICLGVWGFNPLWCLSTPKFVLTPHRKIVKMSQKYIADPLWFSHKSSTDHIIFTISRFDCTSYCHEVG